MLPVSVGEVLPVTLPRPLYSAPVEPWPHQEIVSRRLVESWPYSYMMCDEVGLGKTIEAALAIRSLVLSGWAKRVLIVAPASLTDQWQRELAQKALLPFYKSKPKPGGSGKIQHTRIYPEECELLDNDLYSPDLNIVSSGLVSRKERFAMLRSAQQYDIILGTLQTIAHKLNDTHKPNDSLLLPSAFAYWAGGRLSLCLATTGVDKSQKPLEIRAFWQKERTATLIRIVSKLRFLFGK